MDADRFVVSVQRQNLAAFLTMISRCEGTDGDSGYRALFGYRASQDGPCFDDFHDHPNQRFPFRMTDGSLGFTTAAGRYQLIFATWKRLQAKLGLPDFGPDSQDDAATELISEKNALGDVMAGRFRDALDKCAPVWASLPASRYLQPVRSYDFAQAAYTTAGGVFA